MRSLPAGEVQAERQAQAGQEAQAEPEVRSAALRPSPAAAERPVAGVPPPVPATVPATLSVPALDLSVPLLQLGLQDDGTVEVPVSADDAGWFRLGPPPGRPGSAVVLGHVDSRRGPGVFFRLHTLQVGDAVEVGLVDGSLARFAVTSVETYRKDAFPADLVYGGQGESTLKLVTCGGDFDRTARSYLSNVVVSTSLVGTVTAPPVAAALRR